MANEEDLVSVSRKTHSAAAAAAAAGQFKEVGHVECRNVSFIAVLP